VFPQQQQPNTQQAISLMPPLLPISIPQLKSTAMQQNQRPINAYRQNQPTNPYNQNPWQNPANLKRNSLDHTHQIDYQHAPWT
jgi:hypothetical protein